MGKRFGVKPFIFNLKNWGRVEVSLILKKNIYKKLSILPL